MGTRKNGRARRRHARGEVAPSPLACLPRAHPFSLSPTTSKRLLRRLAPCKRTQHCWMLHVVSVCMHTLFACCCVLLGFVAQSLKPVKLLATIKRTQQLPTLLRLFARSLTLRKIWSSFFQSKQSKKEKRHELAKL